MGTIEPELNTTGREINSDCRHQLPCRCQIVRKSRRTIVEDRKGIHIFIGTAKAVAMKVTLLPDDRIESWTLIGKTSIEFHSTVEFYDKALLVAIGPLSGHDCV